LYQIFAPINTEIQQMTARSIMMINIAGDEFSFMPLPTKNKAGPKSSSNKVDGPLSGVN